MPNFSDGTDHPEKSRYIISGMGRFKMPIFRDWMDQDTYFPFFGETKVST